MRKLPQCLHCSLRDTTARSLTIINSLLFEVKQHSSGGNTDENKHDFREVILQISVQQLLQ